MKSKLALLMGVVVMILPAVSLAYPPAVGIIGKSRDCMSCHANNGPWGDQWGVSD
jgi:hypothetical protein